VKRTALFSLMIMPVAFAQNTPPAAQNPASAPAPAPDSTPHPCHNRPAEEPPPQPSSTPVLFGKVAVNGFLSGYGLLQINHVPGDDTKQADLSNGQVFIQKTDGWFQFYLQAGA
jgi:hypothetical protein